MTAAPTELERFFDLSIDMLCVLGYDGYYKRVNPAFQRTLGFTEAELLAHPFVDFVHPDDREASLTDLETLGPGMQTGVYEERHLHKDGSYRWLQWTAVPGRNESSCYALARDVTDRKLAEEELASSRVRIVEATDAARRRIERDLHDGAQQRLVALSLVLRLAEARIQDDPEAARELLASAREKLAQSLAELRDLAHGIHPAILDRGLVPVLESLAARSSLPVSLTVETQRPHGRRSDREGRLLDEFAGRREPSRRISVGGGTPQPHRLHESGVMVARERDQGRVALHSTLGGGDPATRSVAERSVHR